MKLAMPSRHGMGPLSPIAFLGSLILLGALVVPGRSDIVEINRRLGRGINMGNMFEAPSEEAWGNPWRSGYFEKIADLGFRHVRLPVRWEPADRSMAEVPYTIRSEFLERIQKVIDEALTILVMELSV